MKPKQFLLFLLALMGSFTAHAYDIEMNGVYYNITDATAKTVEVTYVENGEGNADFYYGNITIPKRISTGGVTYTVTAFGQNAFRYCTGLTSINIPDGVTSIGECAFNGCSSLTSISIPESVVYIGGSGFWNCTSLTKAEFASIEHLCSITFITTGSNPLICAKHLYIDGQEVTKVVIPNGVTTIRKCAFESCSFITSVTIPNSVTSIGSWAFEGCSGITKIVLPNSVTSIGGNAFNNCSNLTSVTMPASVINFTGDYAFGENNNIESVYITDMSKWLQTPFNQGNNPLRSGARLYLNNEEVKNLVIPEGTTSILTAAFEGCESLTSVFIPASVTSIGGYAFAGCPNLTSVFVENPSPVTISSYVFSNRANATLYVPAGSRETYQTANCWKEFKEIKEFIIFADANVKAICVANWDTNGDGELSEEEAAAVTDLGSAFSNNSTITSFNELQYFTGLQSISNYAFYQCSQLTSVTLPSCITSIGERAFSWTGLTSIDIPQGVTTIGTSAFDAISNLTSVIIPNSVTEIGSLAFWGCSRLLNITIPQSVTSIGIQAFANCNSLAYAEYTSIEHLCSINFGSGTSNPLNPAQSLYINGEAVTDVVIPNTVTSIGNFAFHGFSNMTSITIPNTVTSIGNNAFQSCSGLTSITIPSSVTSIGNYAFSHCTGFTSMKVGMTTPLEFTTDDDNRANATLYVPAGSKSAYEAADYWKEFKEIKEFIIFADANVKAICVANWDTNGDGELSEEEAAAVTDLGSAFSNNSTITSFNELQYFTGLTKIPGYCFNKCSNLTSVVIPENITQIGFSAFDDCYALASINLPSTITFIDGAAFSDCRSLTRITFPEGIPSIGQYMCDNCSRLTEIVIPNSVTSIGGSAFSGCSGLTSITIPNSVTSIGNDAFQRCTNLVSVVIGNHVTQIGNEAFEYCSSLNSINIPEGVTSIGYSAFNGCSSLTSIAIPESVTSIGASGFWGCTSLTKAEFASIEHLCSISFGTTGSNPLICAKHLYIDGQEVTEVVIPNSVTTINNCAFESCSYITSITIPNSVISIGSWAFEGCSELTSITIPSSITNIGNYAFRNCSSLTSVKVDIATPLSITSETFTNRANATLIVPVGSKAAYEAANYWKEFKRIIEFIEGDVNGDGEMDVVDVVDIARYVVGTPAETFVQILADINNNGDVNLGDVVSLVNMIAGDQNFVKAQRAPQRASEGNEALTLEGTDGMLSLALQNTREYTAFQFDLYVPEATDVTSMLLNAQRKQRHQLLYNKVEDGHWRVAALSTSNRTFIGNAGELLSVAIEGIANDDISIRNIRFFDTQSNEYAFDDICLSGTTTNLEGLTPSSKAEESIYDLQGRKVANRQLTRGIYIVNGKKVVRK